LKSARSSGARRDSRPGGSATRTSIAVLRGTAAASYLREHWADSTDVVEYDGNTDAMAQVRAGLHAATLADLPVAIFYKNLPQGRDLKFVGEPVAPGDYVMYARANENGLVTALNSA